MANYGFIGGDMRAVYAARMLRARGFDVEVAALTSEEEGVGLERAAAADCVVLPMPFEKNGLLNAPFSDRVITIDELAAAVGGKRVLCGGNGYRYFKNYINYAEDEGFILENAAITAEGAAMRYCSLSGRTVRGSRVTVIGYGRVGRAVSALFSAMGAVVTVIARGEAARNEARVAGLSAFCMEGMGCALSDSDGAVNTVPARVITEAQIARLPERAVIVDLASSPGGTDFSAAYARGIRAELSLALPGRTAPYSAAMALCSLIIDLQGGNKGGN